MRPITSALALLLASVVPSIAKADTDLFTFTATTNPALGDFSFELPLVPAYVDPGGVYLATAVIPITTGGQNILPATRWFEGGFSFDSDDYELDGATVSSGGVSDPVFTLGSFSMDEGFNRTTDAGTLLITEVSTPETSSLLLLATGAAGFGTAARRRRA